MTPLFSLIHPTRSRSFKSFNNIRLWMHRFIGDQRNLELIVSLDEDDPELTEYMHKYLPEHRIIGPNKSSVQAINRAAAISKGQILIVASDDTDCPVHWDRVIREAVAGKSDFLLRVSDGHQKRICTLPIMDRAYYNRFGYIYHPDYSHNWCDTELTEVAYKLGRIIVRDDIVFKHLHPEVTKEPKDEVYLKNDLTHDSGRKIFQYRKSINFGL